MAEYLAPGVYVEEVSFRTKPIEGVSTSTAGFVGPARFGPTSGEPVLITSQPEFERIFGGLDQLVFEGARQTNHLAHAVRAFFANGGRRVYVSRVYTPPAAPEPGEGGEGEAEEDRWPGHARLEVPESDGITLVARFPGRAGDMRITLQARLGADVNDGGTLRQVTEHDTVYVRTRAAEEGEEEEGEEEEAGAGIEALFDVVRVGDDLRLRRLRPPEEEGGEPTDETLELTDRHSVRPVTIDVDVERPIERPMRPRERFEPPQSWVGLRLNPNHASGVMRLFEPEPQVRSRALNLPLFVDGGRDAAGAALFARILGEDALTALQRMARVADGEPAGEGEDEGEAPAGPTPEELRARLVLAGGSDGDFPTLADYEGTTEPVRGLRALEDIEDISIVAAPGYSVLLADAGTRADGQSIQQLLLAHCDRMRYRIAVLDSGPGFGVAEVRAQRGRIDSVRGALYYPWVRILDPVTEEELDLPPAGFVTGIYARNDVERGVHKAPANEVVTLAINLGTLINKGQQDVLNPEGINAFRFFEGRGFRLWGARLISSDPEWKYVSDRRYFNYVERSIDRGTQWSVFEPNGPDLWSKVRRSVEEFLFNEWANRRLLGNKPDQAFFVRCDRSTMTQNDLDNGRLVCLIGIAILKPAEFVIFRIGQWTADASRAA